MTERIKEELDEILRLHQLWLHDPSQGSRANLKGADLSRAYLHGAKLCKANQLYLMGINI